MYKVIFTPQAADQYASIIERFSDAKKSLQQFESEIESVIRRLESMPESYPPKGQLRAARLPKSGYYLFFHIAEKEMLVTAIMLISQKASPQNWPDQ
ncbi:MAG: type II toxin-antitoxin system RelE/ParE family toxin [Bacteroidota bacterium]